jgi:hypothetical protein
VNSSRFFFAAFLAASSAAFAGVTVTQLDDRVRIELDGKLFTEYRHTGAPHVYYWPVIGPGGAKMTRAWPMEEVPGEERDHPHHRSLWFSHGAVNGVDFWSEAISYGTRTPKHPIGSIVHDRIVKAVSGETSGELVTAQKWVAPDESVPLTSTQRLVVYQRPDSERMFDFEVTLTAGARDVVLGDTKEGTAAIRIAESMRLKGPKATVGAGKIVNSEGDTDAKVWGRRAKWVSMSGPIDGRTFSIAMFDHPTNPRHPTRWHARDYGLFAANPFCEAEMDKAQPKGAGDFSIKAGDSVTFRYRFIIHEGDDVGKLAGRYAEYAAGKN